jgi:hypothetical protein
MDYYVGFSGRSATFTLMGPVGQTLQKVTGHLAGDAPHELRVKPSGSQLGYPAYEVVTVGGVTDVVEHRASGPTFYMSDDPTVWSQLAPKH